MESLILSAKYHDDLESRPSHYHDCHQLLFIADGEIEINVGKNVYSARKGSLVFINRLEDHSLSIISQVYKRFFIGINPSLPFYDDERDLLLSILMDRSGNFSHVIDVSPFFDKIFGCFSCIVDEYEKQQPMFNQRLDMSLFDLLILIYREYPDLFSKNSDKRMNIIRDIEVQFSENYGIQYSLKDLAEKYHINHYYLSHIFKKVTGYSIMEYLTRCRLAAAKRYLTSTELSIGNIVEQCGFSSSSDFSRIFKAQNGITPSEFRKKYIG